MGDLENRPSGPAQMRISDADRHKVAELLREAAGDGRIDLGELGILINDCYNANPMSMRAALHHLAESPAERRIALLGTMGELGAAAPAFHEEIGAEAATLGIDVLVTVGAEAVGYAAGYGGETYAVATPEEAGALLSEIALPGDRVLIKGSRSVGLERVLA